MGTKRLLGIGGDAAVCPAVHVVDIFEVVCARPQVLELADGLVVDSVVGSLTGLESLNVGLAGNNLHAGEAALEVSSLDELLGGAVDADGEHGGGGTRTERVEEDTLALDLCRGDVGEQRNETTVERCGVHVTTSADSVHAWLELGLLETLAVSGESLLDILVGDGRLAVELSELGGDRGVLLVLGVSDKVVVQQAAETLLYELRVRAVEESVVKVLNLDRSEVGSVRVAVDTVGGTVAELGSTLTVGVVGLVEASKVGLDGLRTVDLGVLRGEVGLVEVPEVAHVGTVSGLEDEGCVRADKHGNGTCTTDGTGRALGVDCNVTSHDNGVTAVPRAALHPVDGVEESGGTAVAGVLAVNALDVVVSGGSKEVHEDSLDGLGLVNDGLGTDIETTNAAGVNVVLLEEARDDCCTPKRKQGIAICARKQRMEEMVSGSLSFPQLTVEGA